MEDNFFEGLKNFGKDLFDSTKTKTDYYRKLSNMKLELKRKNRRISSLFKKLGEYIYYKDSNLKNNVQEDTSYIELKSRISKNLKAVNMLKQQIDELKNKKIETSKKPVINKISPTNHTQKSLFQYHIENNNRVEPFFKGYVSFVGLSITKISSIYRVKDFDCEFKINNGNHFKLIEDQLGIFPEYFEIIAPLNLIKLIKGEINDSLIVEMDFAQYKDLRYKYIGS